MHQVLRWLRASRTLEVRLFDLLTMRGLASERGQAHDSTDQQVELYVYQRPADVEAVEPEKDYVSRLITHHINLTMLGHYCGSRID